MRIFVVNLDTEVERFEKLSARARDLQITIERFPAIYGKGLSFKEKHKRVSYFKWSCIVGQPPTDGEIGCALSHMDVYKRILDEKIPFACILEDDVVLAHQFKDVLRQVETFCQTNKSAIILLSNKHGVPNTINQITKVKECATGTYGYVITNEAAKAIVVRNRLLKCPSDFWPWLFKNKDVQLYKAFPTVCTYDVAYVSKTTLGKIKVSQMSCWNKVLYKMKRGLGIVIAHLFLR